MAVIDLLENKTAGERATIKGEELAKITSIARTTVETYDIQITEVNEITK